MLKKAIVSAGLVLGLGAAPLIAEESKYFEFDEDAELNGKELGFALADALNQIQTYCDERELPDYGTKLVSLRTSTSRTGTRTYELRSIGYYPVPSSVPYSSVTKVVMTLVKDPAPASDRPTPYEGNCKTTRNQSR